MEPFQPKYFDMTKPLREEVGHVLCDVIDTMLVRTWIVWDLTGDEWWRFAPVILGFCKQTIAIDFRLDDELSISCVHVDIDENPQWLVSSMSSEEYIYEWRADALLALSAVVGRELENIDVVWRDFDIDWGIYAVTFQFDKGVLEIVNDFDGKDLLSEMLVGPQYDREQL